MQSERPGQQTAAPAFPPLHSYLFLDFRYFTKLALLEPQKAVLCGSSFVPTTTGAAALGKHPHAVLGTQRDRGQRNHPMAGDQPELP